jgi:hypothetical protein
MSNISKIITMQELERIFRDTRVWFFDGAGYHHVKHVGIVDNMLVISQQETPKQI